VLTGKWRFPQPRADDHGSGGDRAAHASRRAPWTVVPPSALVLTGVFSVQFGAGLAAKLFTQIAPAAVTGLRLWTSAAVMAIVGARPLRNALSGLVGRRSWRDAAVVGAFGVTLAVMNFSIYQSFARIPLGISVTVEFLGPLGLAVATSRRLLDLLWVAFAGIGVALLAHGGLSGAAGSGTVAIGLAFALLSALSWAGYILLSRATGQRFGGSTGLTIAMLAAAVVITPVGVAAGGRTLLRPDILLAGVGIGLLSSIIPYSLEMEALRRIPPRVFGIWMSLEPAVAALVGLVLLGQALAVREWLAIGCVMIACAGAARGAKEPGAPGA
jgi:inner membrane transporter RhtA